MANPLIQPDLIAYSLLAGFGVGAGGFALVVCCSLVGQELHPDTAQVWTFLWLALSYTAALTLLGVDVFVGGPGDFMYALLVGAGATGGYVLGAAVVGRPWLSTQPRPSA